jgi:hypothetical protein
MPNINWKNPARNLYFSYHDLKVNDTFRIVGGRGAVYTKVSVSHGVSTHDIRGCEFMMEVATGLLFEPTSSNVELVQVDVQIASPKPYIYK